MLLDDNEEMVTLISTILSFEDIEIIPVELTSDPVDQINKHKPDFLLLDVKLGEYDGIEILEQIRKNPQMEDVMIFSTSGLNYSEKCLEMGAQGFLQKPFLPSDLLEMIKRFS